MRVGVVFAVLLASGLVLFAATSDFLIAPAQAASSGDWKIVQKTDPITGSPASTALLRSSKTTNSALAFTPAGYLQLGCFKGKPSIGFAFEFNIGSTKDVEFGYRFNTKRGRQIEPRVLSNHKTIVIEAKADVGRFAAELAASKALYVQIRSLTEGQTGVEFQVDGAPTAIDAAFAGCPL